MSAKVMCCQSPPLRRNFINTHIASQLLGAALSLQEYLHERLNFAAIVPAPVFTSVSGVVGSAWSAAAAEPPRVGVAVGVLVGVVVGVSVGVTVGVLVGVIVGVFVGV